MLCVEASLAWMSPNSDLFNLLLSMKFYEQEKALLISIALIEMLLL